MWDYQTNEVLHFHKTYKNNLGNLVLLPVGKNSKLGNKTFAEKKQIYQNTDYVITKNISSFTDWTKAEIEETHGKYIDNLLEALDISKIQ